MNDARLLDADATPHPLTDTIHDLIAAHREHSAVLSALDKARDACGNDEADAAFERELETVKAAELAICSYPCASLKDAAFKVEYIREEIFRFFEPRDDLVNALLQSFSTSGGAQRYQVESSELDGPISAGIAEDAEKEVYELLHTFPRRGAFLDMSEHLMMAARLSRSLWEALGNADLDVEPRTRLGLQCLASEVADHASAADVLFQLDSVRKSVAK